MPARVILQDFTGVPARRRPGRDARRHEARWAAIPRGSTRSCPVDLVIDHSVQVDAFGTPDAARAERRARVRAQPRALRVPALGPEGVPQLPRRAARHRHRPPGEPRVPRAGVVLPRRRTARRVALPDTLVGTDSHTTMINGLGVLGWGVGGIEAEAAMLGQPLSMLMPQVVGFRLIGALREGATATDLVLTVTQMLRKKGVVDKFVEFFGPGLAEHVASPTARRSPTWRPSTARPAASSRSTPRRSRYLRLTGRGAGEVDLVERYCKEQGLFRTDAHARPRVHRHARARPRRRSSRASPGPKRPQDRVPLAQMKAVLPRTRSPRRSRSAASASPRSELATHGDASSVAATQATLGHGAVVIAAITCCTNTSNPSVMLAAGLLAQEGGASAGSTCRRGSRPASRPARKVVTEYLTRARACCATSRRSASTSSATAARPASATAARCRRGRRRRSPRASSSPRPCSRATATSRAASTRDVQGQLPRLAAAGRRLRARRHDRHRPRDRAARHGQRRRSRSTSRDIWPTQAEVAAASSAAIDAEMFRAAYGNVFDGNPTWNAIPVAGRRPRTPGTPTRPTSRSRPSSRA